MLQSKLLHPDILKTLGTAGHGSVIVIPDGNYPFVTHTNPLAPKVYLNLMPGVVGVTQVVEALVSAIPVEAAHVMMPAQGPEPSIFAEFRQLLPNVDLQSLGRFEFYDKAKQPDVALVIATAEQRIYANIMLTIGVVMPPG